MRGWNLLVLYSVNGLSVGNFRAPNLASQSMEAINGKQSTIPHGKVDGIEIQRYTQMSTATVLRNTV